MKEQEYDENAHERHFVVFIVAIIFLIIILYLIDMSFGQIEHRPLIPTGNVDIFDITFDKCCDCDCNTGGSICPGGDKPVSGGTVSDKPKPDNPPSQEEPKPDDDKPSSKPSEETGVEVFDKETSYSDNTKLNIFTKTAYYVVKDKIAPASENSYQFVIRNNNNFNIKYDINFSEVNDYKINMKYRLKLNGEYVVGNADKWVTFDELNQYEVELSLKNYDVYTLDWKWFESKQDTLIGTSIDADYSLNIVIGASEI